MTLSEARKECNLKKKKDKNTIIIILINLFFGWTFIGWIGVLIWIINENKGGYDG